MRVPVCRRALRWAVIPAVVAVLLFAPASAAMAHAVLTASDPVNGASLSRAPTSVVLRFSEKLLTTASSAQLVDGGGHPVAGARVVAGSPSELTVRLPRLVAGSYALVWRVAGVSDGHPSEGILMFTVDPSAAGAATSLPSEAGRPVDIILRWLRMVLLAGLLGGLVLAGPVLAPATVGSRGRLLATTARRLRRNVLGIAVVCAAGAGAVTLADFAMRPFDPLSLGGAAVCLAAVPVLLTLRRAVVCADPAGYPSPTAWVAGASLAGAACLLVAVVDGGNVTNDDVLAGAAMAAWVFAGCLVLGLAGIVAALLWPAGLVGARRAVVVRSVRRPLVRIAVVSATVAVATGLYGAGRAVDSVAQLAHTTRGQLLLAQAGLVLVIGWLAVVGTLRLSGRASHGTARRLPVRGLVAAGMASGVALLGLAVLGQSVTDTGPTRAAQAQPVVRGAQLDDLVVSVSVVPNRTGFNGFTVRVASSRRPAPEPIERVALTYPTGTGPAVVPLAVIEPGRYFGTGTLRPGAITRLVTVVHRGGADISVPIDWPAPGEPPAAPRAGSLPALLNQLAVVLLSLAVGLTAWWLVLSRHRWRVDFELLDSTATPLLPK